MKMSKTFEKLLSRVGEPVVFSRTTNDTFNPDTGAFVAGATITFNGFAAADQYNISEVDGTNVLRSDLKLTVSKTEQKPEVGDMVLFNDIMCRVMDVYPPRFAGEDIVYVIQGRV